MDTVSLNLKASYRRSATLTLIKDPNTGIRHFLDLDFKLDKIIRWESKLTDKDIHMPPSDNPSRLDYSSNPF